jgi:integrase
MELQSFQNYCHEEYIKEKKPSLEPKWEKKELTHLEARKVVQYLRDCCAENSSKASHIPGKRIKGKKRSTSAIVWSWQVYLIVKILVFLPVRQQEIRQLKLGETLFRKIDEKGHPYYEAKITEHKNKSKTGRDRKYKLPSILTADLDAWIDIRRPKAVEAVQTLESWLEFFNDEIEDVEWLQQRIEMAKQGYTKTKVKDIQKYIKSLETQLISLKKRIEAWSSAKANLAEHKSLFFMMGKSHTQGFGKPFTGSSLYSLVTTAISKATTALYGVPYYTNPHALRHIAAKHIRKNNGDAKRLANLMGHSETQGDEYAAQIMTESDLLHDFSDKWWEEENENEDN